MKNIIEYKYIYLKNDYFNHKRDTRERNDIIYLKYSDGMEACRIYFNNVEEFVEISYDTVMISYISKITWTKDAKNEKGIFIKSQADGICLSNLLKKYNKAEKYKVGNLTDETIDQYEKSKRRKEFIIKNPKANTDNPE